MKKAFYVAAIATTVLLTSCSSCRSGWSCKARYVKADTQAKKQNEQVA